MYEHGLAFAADLSLDGEAVLDALWLAHWGGSELISSIRSPGDAVRDEPALGPVERSATPPVQESPPSPIVQAADTSRMSRITPANETEDDRRGLYPYGATAFGDRAIASSPIRIPAGSALSNSLELVRAIRAVPAFRDSRTARELDADATADATARNLGKLALALRPSREKWYDIALVVEDASSSEIWADTIVEIERFLAFSGVFRDVRTHVLNLGPVPHLVARSGVAQNVNALRDPSGRRVVLFFSTGVAAAWTDGRLGQVLAQWGQTMPVALVHALPERLWNQTRLGEPPAFATSPFIGAANTKLTWRPAWWSSGLSFSAGSFPLPVFGLESHGIRRWAQMFARRRRTSAPTMLVPLIASAVTEPDDEDDIDAGARVQAFFANASVEAGRLAVALAIAPFTIPVMRVVQDAVLGGAARHEQIAEVLLSGFVERVAEAKATVTAGGHFRFIDDARRVLLWSLRRDDAIGLVRALETFIEREYETTRDTLVAIEDPDGVMRLPEAALPFVAVRRAIVERLGFTPSQPKRMEPVHANRALDAANVYPTDTFTGRDFELRALAAGLETSSTVAILGTAGVGKSTLAREFAWRSRLEYDVIWWLDGRSLRLLCSSIDRLGAVLGVERSTDSTDEQAAYHVLRTILHRKVSALVIVDDLDGDDRDVIGFLNKSELPRSIITTRYTSGVQPLELIELDAWSEDEAMRYLESAAILRGFQAGEAAEIISLLKALPDALAQLVAFLRVTNAAPGQLLWYLRTTPHAVPHRPGLAAYTELIFQALLAAERIHPGASSLFALLSFLPRLELDGRWFEAASAGDFGDVAFSPISDVARGGSVAALLRSAGARDAIQTMASLKLVTTIARPMIAIAEVAASVVRESIEPATIAWIDAAVNFLIGALSGPRASADRRLDDVVRTMLDDLAEDEMYDDLYGRLALAWAERHVAPVSREAADILGTGILALERWGADPSALARALLLAGRFAQGAGRYSEAIAFLERAVALGDRTPLPNQTMFDVFVALVATLGSVGRADEARRFVQRAYDVFALEAPLSATQPPRASSSDQSTSEHHGRNEYSALFSQGVDIVAVVQYTGSGKTALDWTLIRPDRYVGVRTAAVRRRRVNRLRSALTSLGTAAPAINDVSHALEGAVPLELYTMIDETFGSSAPVVLVISKIDDVPWEFARAPGGGHATTRPFLGAHVQLASWPHPNAAIDTLRPWRIDKPTMTVIQAVGSQRQDYAYSEVELLTATYGASSYRASSGAGMLDGLQISSSIIHVIVESEYDAEMGTVLKFARGSMLGRRLGRAKIHGELVVFNGCAVDERTARALLAAGASAVVAPWLAVTANAAFEFASSFYRHVFSGRSCIDALRIMRASEPGVARLAALGYRFYGHPDIAPTSFSAQ